MARRKPKSKAKKPKPRSKTKAKSQAKSRAKAKARRKPAAKRTAAAPIKALAATIGQILDIAARSAIARYDWEDRGVAPRGYIKGMAVVYARVYCKLLGGDPFAVEMAKKAQTASRDALAWYDDEFRALGMRNDTPGVDTLRHLFVLLIGLGMRESSGRHCEGRDQSASNTTAETAEAGLFQTSFNARSGSPLLPRIFTHYLQNPSGFVEIFGEGVRCTADDLENSGSGQGREFQRLSKESPAFATEFAAVGLRDFRKHWGPITRKEVEIKAESDAMLREVQNAVAASPELCALLQ
jgi:hypothetical protein